MSILSRARVALRARRRNPHAVAVLETRPAARAKPAGRPTAWYSDDERRMVLPADATNSPGLVDSNADGVSDPRRFATAALVGLPNAGKSTLMNSLVGRRVAAVSRKINTTQRRVVGAMTHELSQVAFFDSPGVLPHTEVSPGLTSARRSILTEGWRAAEEADLCFLVVDGAVRNPNTWIRVALVAKQLAKVRAEVSLPLGLVIAKADLKPPPSLPFAVADRISELTDQLPGVFENTYLLSAMRHTGIQSFRQSLFDACRPGEWIYPAGTFSGDPPVAQVHEILREKFLHRVHDEIPYRIEYETESWATSPKGILRINQCVRVPSDRHIPIVIGKRGETIEWIRQSAQQDISAALGHKVNLFLRVASHGR